MSNQEKKDNNGTRIKEERVRLGFTQAQIAQKCTVSRVQWGKYERDVNRLDGDVLRRFGECGADTQYVLTGKRKNDPTNMSESEKRLYRLEHAEAWVNEAEQQNHTLHPALKQALISAVIMHGLTQAGVFNLVDTLALIERAEGRHTPIIKE